MPMYMEDVATREFVVAQEGYDREEVRAFLEVVARDQQALHDEITALREQRQSGLDVGTEIASLLQNARSQAEDTMAKAQEEAERIRARAEEDADRLRQATIDASDRAREEADLYAFETRAKADREARDKLREANEKVEGLLASVATVRDRLYGLDSTLVGLRADVAAAADSLDAKDIRPIEASELPPPPPPPAVIDLTDASMDGTKVATDA